MRQHILVTGGQGLVGQSLSNRLLTEGFRVRISTRQIPKSKNSLLDYVQTTDLNATTDWSSALQNVCTIVHCAARVHVMNETMIEPLTAFRVTNVEGTLNLARQAAASGVKRFIFISSIKVNGECTLPGKAFTEIDTPNPQDAYGQSKHEAEIELRQLASVTPMEVVIIRPPLVYGPGVKANFAALMRVVLLGWPLPLGSLHNKRSLISVHNLSDFIFTCITNSKAANQTFLVSDGHDLSTSELVRSIAQASGVVVRLLPVPIWMLKVVACVLRKSKVLSRLCDNLQIDASKAHSLLSWIPPITAENALKELTINSYRTHTNL